MKTKSVTKITLLSIFVMSVITSVTLNSCQKEGIKPRIVNTSAKSKGTPNLAASNALLVNDINNIIFSMRKDQKKGIIIGGGTDSSFCTVITIDTIDKPNSVSYNYGSNCIGSDGNVRSGSITVTYNAPDIRTVNNVITATMQNYTINGKVMNGSYTVTNVGYNSNNNLALTETGTITSQSSQQIEAKNITMNYNYEWIAGVNSSPAANWQFSITGGWTCSYVAGQMDSMVITTPLIKNAKDSTCNYFIQGTGYQVTKTPMGEQYQYIDYSTPGGCTGQYTVTQDSVATIENQ